ncbi:hypothetical protein M153_1000164436 [Pseudoloma neurophilia]|uniref:Uncharacterized protein n=1 Tax=Pseudoloma neurophilia TaxID=146866 RepID=A0A0R0M5G6_9MICR|nr:hypothetical protein M153_1000164436 [Pseudoloma neurophilia]
MLIFSWAVKIVCLSVKIEPGEYVLESGLARKKNIKVASVGKAGSTARAKKWPEDPFMGSGEQVVLKFIPRNDNKYLIQSVEGKYLCAKPKDPGVVFCPKESDDNTFWTIEKRPKDKGYALKTKGGVCLRLTSLDRRKETKGFYIQAKKCRKKMDHNWKIRKLKPKPDEEKKPKSEKDDPKKNQTPAPASPPKPQVVKKPEEDEPEPNEPKRTGLTEEISDYEEPPPEPKNKNPLAPDAPGTAPPSKTSDKTLPPKEGAESPAPQQGTGPESPAPQQGTGPESSAPQPGAGPESPAPQPGAGPESPAPQQGTGPESPAPSKPGKKPGTGPPRKELDTDEDVPGSILSSTSPSSIKSIEDTPSDLKDLDADVPVLNLNDLKTGDPSEKIRNAFRETPTHEESSSSSDAGPKKSLKIPDTKLSISPFKLSGPLDPANKTQPPTLEQNPSLSLPSSDQTPKAEAPSLDQPPAAPSSPNPSTNENPGNDLISKEECKNLNKENCKAGPTSKDFKPKNPQGKCENIGLTGDVLLDKLAEMVSKRLGTPK